MLQHIIRLSTAICYYCKKENEDLRLAAKKFSLVFKF
jgi:hypothetical protein